MIRLITLLTLVLFPCAIVQAATLNTAAKQAIMFDYETGTVLFENDADKQMPTSSMSKVITAYVIFDALKAGTIKLDDTFNVSEKAWRKGCTFKRA